MATPVPNPIKFSAASCALTALAALIVFSPANISRADSNQPRKVTVSTVDLDGWPGAYQISNGVIQVTVIPQIGRIMSYSLVGRPETDPIWTYPAMYGQPIPTGPWMWGNYGGDKVWPGDQVDWGKHMVRGWPPDPAFDYGPFVVTDIHNGVRLTGPNSIDFAAHSVRDIVLGPGPTEVTINDTFIKSKDATGDYNGFPMCIWTITQLPIADTVFLPINPDSKFPDGYVPDPATADPMVWRRSNGLFVIGFDPAKTVKMATDNREGWLAAIYNGDWLFSETQSTTSGDRHPYNYATCDVYSCDDAPPKPHYFELEQFSAIDNLMAGQSMHFSRVWNLRELPHKPTDIDDSAKLVNAAMKGTHS